MKTSTFLLATLTGTGLEFFEFTLLILFSKYIQSNFLNNGANDQTVILILFSLGYLARPLGGLLFGHFGDRYGRKIMFIVSIILMSLSTLLIGLLPGYDKIGECSIVLLIVLRIGQGLALGGEIAGVNTFASEHVKPGYRGLITSTTFACNGSGAVLASLLGLLLSHVFTADAMQDYGWRIPFLVGGTLGLIGLFFRTKLDETPAFKSACQEDKIHRLPSTAVFKTSWPQVLIAIALSAIIGMVVSFILYLPTYAIQAQIDGINTFQLSTVGFLLITLLAVPSGYCSDKVGRRPVLLLGVTGILTLISILFYTRVNLQTPEGLWMLMIGIAAMGSLIGGSHLSAIIELFNTETRYSGFAISYNLGFALVCGLSPLCFNSLTQHFNLHYAMMIMFSVTSLLAVAAIGQMPKDSYQKPLYIH